MYVATLETLKQKIKKARLKAALTANINLLAIYWEIGNSIAEQERNKDGEQKWWVIQQEFPLHEELCNRVARIIYFN